MKLMKTMIATALVGAMVATSGAFAEEMAKGKACDKHGATASEGHGAMMGMGGDMGGDMAGHSMGAMMGEGMMGGHGDGAMGGHGGDMMGGSYMDELMPMLHSLNLNPEQHTKVRAIMKELRNKTMTLTMKRYDIADDLQTAYESSDRPDPAKVGEIYGKLFDVRKETIVAALQAKNKIAELLTPDQLKLFNAYRRDYGHRMMMR